jgi:SAM-dependent methyltransferase
MALLKLYRHARRHGFGSLLRKTGEVLPGYLANVHRWRVRRCRCCDRITLFLSSRPSPEFRACLFCSANERYELLATEIKHRFGGDLPEKQVLELDPHSPVRHILSHARGYTRSFFDAGTPTGSKTPDGVVCQDITRLTFANETLDLIVSSDVLEHVPHLDAAFRETARVLRPGGVHLFTVPPRPKTKRRADLVDGAIRHIEAPEYHLDPLSPGGILAFWDIGPDLPEVFQYADLKISVAYGPVGDDGRVVWMAERPR